MDNINLPELHFDESNHAYTVYGMSLPSVTSIMRPLSDRQYGGINKDTLGNAANRGTQVHQAIEMYLLYGMDDIPEGLEGYYEAFKNWLPDIPERQSECKLYHQILRYAGTVDVIYPDDYGVVIVDFKTTSTGIEMLERVQTEAYARIIDSLGLIVTKKVIVHLKSNGTYKESIYESSDNQAWEVFTSLMNIDRYLTQYKK